MGAGPWIFCNCQQTTTDNAGEQIHGGRVYPEEETKDLLKADKSFSKREIRKHNLSFCSRYTLLYPSSKIRFEYLILIGPSWWLDWHPWRFIFYFYTQASSKSYLAIAMPFPAFVRFSIRDKLDIIVT